MSQPCRSKPTTKPPEEVIAQIRARYTPRCKVHGATALGREFDLPAAYIEKLINKEWPKVTPAFKRDAHRWGLSADVKQFVRKWVVLNHPERGIRPFARALRVPESVVRTIVQGIRKKKK